MNHSGRFMSQQAPCGRIVESERYEDHDDEVVMTQEVDYQCGCRTVQREYHDGTVSRKVVLHDGRVLVDEILSAE
jgi:membrane-bound inhibitor of C-type lysozyme